MSRFISRHVGAHEIQTLREKSSSVNIRADPHILAVNGDKEILFKFM